MTAVLSPETKAAIGRLGAPAELPDVSRPTGWPARAERKRRTDPQESPHPAEPHPVRVALVRWLALVVLGIGLQVLGVIMLLPLLFGTSGPPGTPEPSETEQYMEEVIGWIGVVILILGMILMAVSPAPLFARGVPWPVRVLAIVWVGLSLLVLGR